MQRATTEATAETAGANRSFRHEHHQEHGMVNHLFTQHRKGNSNGISKEHFFYILVDLLCMGCNVLSM